MQIYEHYINWLNLLDTGHSDAEKIDNWNMCLFSKIENINAFFPNNIPENVEKMKNSYSSKLNSQEFNERVIFPTEHQELPELPQEPNVRIESYMDFSEETFRENISFAGRVLIGADFRNAVFEGWADFRGAVFLGLTHFEGARFKGRETMQPASHGQISFANSVFCNTVSLKDTEFLGITSFDTAEFLSAGYFQNAIFGMNTEQGGVVFNNVKFGSEANFSNTTFKGAGRFKKVEFNGHANFNNSIFNGTTIFRGATFRQPPKFFEANVHEDVNFNGIDWHQAERSYSKPKNKDVTRDEITERAENAVLAWERLTLIMSEQEKPWERHQFFRLKMRAKRHADGIMSISSIANRIFDVLSDYGWGIGRAFAWWFGHIVLFGVILTITADYQIREHGGQPDWTVPRDGFLVSLSNSLSFLRLQRGYLSSYFEELAKVLEQVMWLFSLVGTLQAILGPILLFLVFLALRNHFRLG